MLRDRLVVGIQDLSLSEKLQADPTLTLEKAKTQIRQKAAEKDHRLELQQQPSNEARVAKLRGHKTPQKQSDSKTGHTREGAYSWPQTNLNVHVVVVIDTSQEANAQPQVWHVTNVTRKDTLVPIVLQSVWMQ